MDIDNRKKIKDDYKSKTAIGAVYAIECSGNARSIVKSTMDIQGIKNRFRFAVTTKSCPDPALVGELAQYGVESFALVVLEELRMKEGQTSREFSDDVELLRELWMEKLAAGD